MKYTDPDYKLGGKAGLLLQFSESNKSNFIYLFFLQYLGLVLYHHLDVKLSPSKSELPFRDFNKLLYPEPSSLSCPTPPSLRMEVYPRQAATGTEQDPVGTPRSRPLHVPYFLFGIPLVPKNRLKCLMIRTVESQGLNLRYIFELLCKKMSPLFSGGWWLFLTPST